MQANIIDSNWLSKSDEAAALIDRILHGHPNHSKILFVGCRWALPLMDRIATMGHQVSGIDESWQIVEELAGRAPGPVSFVQDIICHEPLEKFDIIFTMFSLYHRSLADMRSLIFRISDWLVPTGSLLVATTVPSSVAGNTDRPGSAGDVVRAHSFQLNGTTIQSTLYSRTGWINQCEKAGLTFEVEEELQIQTETGSSVEYHSLMAFRKHMEYAIMGPYPLPDDYRGPIPLSEAAWKPFVERLVRDEFDFVLEQLETNRKVLDVGSGYGRLPVELAARKGVAYSIEPNPDRNMMQLSNGAASGVEVLAGGAEDIPYPDGFFDACVAMWVLHYVDDLERSLREMVRVTDITDPDARIIIVQGAPENEVIELMNTVCAPVSASNKRPNHQGYLLHTAAKVFAECGFGHISLHRVDAYCKFTEEDISLRCERASEVIAGLWCLEDENFNEMKKALMPQLEHSFQDRSFAIGDQVAVLVARP